MGFIISIIIGAIAGWLAGKIVKGGGQGLLMNIVVGVLGALLAGWLFPSLGWNLGAGPATGATVRRPDESAHRPSSRQSLEALAASHTARPPPATPKDPQGASRGPPAGDCAVQAHAVSR